MSPRARAAGGDPAQDGSISLLLAVAVFGLILAVGLVLDGGLKLRSTQRADDVAAEAARAAVLSVQPGDTVRGLPPRVDPSAARTAAREFLRRAGLTGTVTVSGNQVEVRTQVTFTPQVLTLIGVGPQTVQGSARARLARGLDTEQP